MISILLTLLCLFIIVVCKDVTTIIVMVVVMGLIWFVHMVAVDDAKAHINLTDYWSRSGKERALQRRRWEAEAREEEERARRSALESEQKRAELLAWHEAKRSKANSVETEAPSDVKTPALLCDRCGHEVRIIHETTYPSGKTYAEYQCPYCGERKLKHVG